MVRRCVDCMLAMLCSATRGKKGTECTEVVDLGASTRVEDAPNSPSDGSLTCADSVVSLMLS